MDIVTEQVAAYNARDVERFLATYHPDAVLLMADGSEMMRGQAAMRDFYRTLFATSPKLHCKVVHRIDLGNWVILHEQVTGLVATGVPAEINAGAVYWVAGGLITKVLFLR